MTTRREHVPGGLRGWRWVGALGLGLAVLWSAGGARAEEEPASKPEGYTPKVFEPPLKDRGDKALGEGKHAEAITLYAKALEASPRDANTRYNLACAYALSGQREKALIALETAIDAGFKDLAHAQQDTDLASVQKEARFRAAIERGQAKEAAGEIAGMKRHALSATTLGTYIVLLPPDYAESTREYPVVFILHGSGSSEIGHGRLAEVMGREGVIYVAPRALHPHTGVFTQSGKPGWTAWPPERAAAGDGAPDPMALYTDWIARCAKDVARRYRMHGERIFVWGHSQGAGAANVLAALHPKLVASYFAYAGYYPESITEQTLAALKTHGVYVELCHGEQDKVVDPEPTRAMDARLEKAGVAHAVHMVKAEHRLTEEVQALSKAWADKRARASVK